MKRRICVIAVLLLLLTTFGVHAGTKQHIVLSSFNDTVMLSATEAPTVWECPTLAAGESLTHSGILQLENRTDTECILSLDHVALPYDNDEALDYLNHVHITVKDGTHTLYDGPYSRINDKDGLSLHYTLSPTESVMLTVDLRCDYTFTGKITGFENGTLLDWKFYTVLQKEAEQATTSFNDPALREIVIAAGVAAVLLIGVGVYDLWRRRTR